jgi:ribosomal protein L11 methyltransferase
MKWAALSATCPPQSEEPVAACFIEAGCEGVRIESTRAGTRIALAITGYLPVDDRLEGALLALQNSLVALREFDIDPGDGRLTTRFVQDEDWAEAWKRFYHPLRVGRSLVIKPSWESFSPRPGDQIIELDPGMAFGTGAHPTTQLCLALLEERLTPGDRVLDLGTGSGILAIAAAMLGASRVLALDLDPIAVAAARENAARNSAADRVTVHEGSVEAAGRASYDLVVSNILADVIRDLAPDLARLTRPGGLLLASGIIADRAGEVVAALAAAGLHVEAERADQEWRALVARRDTRTDPGR